MSQNQTPQFNNCSAAQPLHSGLAHLSAESSSSEQSPSEFSSRLIPLCDGRPGLRTTLQIHAQSSPSDQAPGASPLPVIDFVSSNATLDRYDETISPAGWRLENYRRNPVFQNAHQYGDIIFTLGKALLTEVRATPFPHLFQRIEFAVDVNPMARIAYGLYKNKFLNAVSVGFIPIRWENADGTQHFSRRDTTDPYGGAGAMNRAGVQSFSLSSPGGEGRGEEATLGLGPHGPIKTGHPTPRRTYLEQELLEVSAVGIPANPEALQLGLKSGAIEKNDLQALVELLMENTATQPIPGLHHPPSIHPTICRPGAASHLNLLQLARALRDLLRRT